jgi:hypothetical protein
MKSLSEKYDDPKFGKMVKRDAKILAVIIIISWLSFFLAPLIAYLGQKYNW